MFNYFSLESNQEFETDNKLNKPFAEVQLSSSPEYRIFGLGDCHGDLPNSVRILRMAGVINDMNNWVAGDSILVQTGDIVVFPQLLFLIPRTEAQTH